MLIKFLGLKQAGELVYCDACLAKDSAQGAAVQFTMVRHRYLSEGLVPAEDHVTAFLSLQDKTSVAERLCAITA